MNGKQESEVSSQKPEGERLKPAFRFSFLLTPYSWILYSAFLHFRIHRSAFIVSLAPFECPLDSGASVFAFRYFSNNLADATRKS